VKPVAVRRVLEPSTIDLLTDLLKGVVTDGTGRHAAVPGYVVAGKTGTAQKVDPSGRYSMIDHVASFVGFVPASRPALVILVSLDTPRGPRNEGGDVAAPAFARIAEHALRHLAIPPDDPERSLRVIASYRPPTATVVPAAYHPAAVPVPPEGENPRVMPDLRGRSAREAATLAARLGLIVELEAGAACALKLGRPLAAAQP
jgi:membrane peptidoglycan carboxypeptidase